jgi:hypothetical protein
MSRIGRYTIARGEAEWIELRGAMTVDTISDDQLVDAVLQQGNRCV